METNHRNEETKEEEWDDNDMDRIEQDKVIVSTDDREKLLMVKSNTKHTTEVAKTSTHNKENSPPKISR
jgi:hypothetical protein